MDSTGYSQQAAMRLAPDEAENRRVTYTIPMVRL